MTASNPFHIYPCGDYAVTIELGDSIAIDINNKVISLFTYLQAQKHEAVKDIIPSYHTVTVVYDVLLLQKTNRNISAYQLMSEWLLQALEQYTISTTAIRNIHIPVCYDFSPVSDLPFIAEQHGLSVDEVIRLHISRTYRVYLLGFLPGFAYMGTVDERIVTPRKTSPRTSIPAGSVGIAGEQTGIYPFASPGGWQILGQTPLQLFSVTDTNTPCLLQSGDEVSFYAINREEFQSIKDHGHTHS